VARVQVAGSGIGGVTQSVFYPGGLQIDEIMGDFMSVKYLSGKNKHSNGEQKQMKG